MNGIRPWRQPVLHAFTLLLTVTGIVFLVSSSRTGAGSEPGRNRAGSTKTPSEAAPPDHSKHSRTGPESKATPAVRPEDAPPAFWFRGGRGMYVPPFYDSFASLDLSSLNDLQRERFLHWVNVEYCSCAQQGCQRDTVANCFVKDAQCPRAPVRMREILDRVKNGASVPGSIQPLAEALPALPVLPAR